VRDSWESVKDNLCGKISTLLGETYTAEVNMNALYAYAEDSSYGKNTPGELTKRYYEGFIYQLERFLTACGDDGKQSFNECVSAKKISLEIDESVSVGYCGCDIKDGRFRILSGPTYLGTNIDDACMYILKAVEAAEAASGAGGLSVGAKANVKDSVDKKFPGLEKELSEILGTKITLDANLEANYKKNKTESGFNDGTLGDATVAYFEGFKYQLEYLKFKGDEMMQEAFQDQCAKSIIQLEVVDKLSPSSYTNYNDVIFEDGICKMQVFLGRS
jgi:hypothetical protein